MSGLSQERVHEIIHRHSLGQSVRSIARTMRVSRRAVQRVLDEHAAGRQQGPPHPDLPRRRAPRGSAVDAYEEQIGGFLERYPNMTSSMDSPALYRSQARVTLPAAFADASVIVEVLGPVGGLDSQSR
ncbi:MAG TPA: hypothetical protein PK867_17765 [Pirellulales bacterium]|nr:hypothetical protein [Pirellulales bacterium]